jgi:hypothetical protein
MTARILVVDDVYSNLKLLETRLSAEYSRSWRRQMARRDYDLQIGRLRYRSSGRYDTLHERI